MGRIRRNGRLTAPEVLAANMPAELNMLEFCSTVEGLRLELHRIAEWLEGQCPGYGKDLLHPVLQHIGFDQAEWYRRVLMQGPEGGLL